jgi:hypothetical protein
VTHQMGRHALAQPRPLCGNDARLPEDLGGDGRVGAPAVDSPRKQPRLRPHLPVVHAERGEERGAEGDVAVAPALPMSDVTQHAPAVDVPNLQMPELGIPHTGRVQHHQHGAMRQAMRLL